MNKVNRIFTTISISLIALLAIGFAGTFVSDYLVSVNWFDDYSNMESRYGGRSREYFYWGARHYWYNWGVFFLFITSLARCVVKVVVIAEEKPRT